MTNRKQLHNWMKENHFLQSDYQKIRDLYFETFQQVLPFRISVGNGIDPKTVEDFRNGLKMFGFASNENTPTYLTGNLGVKVKDCKDCEYSKKDKHNVAFAKCSFNNDGNLVVDKISIRQSLEVPELDIDQFEIPRFGFTLQNLPSEDLLNFFLGASNQKPKEKFAPKDGDIVVSGWGDKENGAEWIAVVKGEFADERYDCYCLYILQSGAGNKRYFVFNSYSNSHKFTRPATEQEKQLLLFELQKAGKIWNADKKQIEDDKRINVDKIDFKKCLADRDFTPYFPTKEIQDMAREWDKGVCCIRGFMDCHKVIYNDCVSGNHCKGIKCIEDKCPFSYENKSLLLSMKPFAKELTDKEKFDKWRDDNGYSALVGYNENQDKLSRKLSAINMICLCAKYLNGDWKLDLSTSGKDKNKRYFIYSTLYNDGLDTHSEDDCCSKGHAYFKTEELALKAIEILGDDLIKTAYSTDY